jgi:hypothetical protein
MLRAAINHNIGFHFLPPHTTHQLQPLDVGIFGPLQRKWQGRCDEVITATNAEIPRNEFVKEYMGIRNAVFTEELIKSAWKKAGMYPLNSQKFTEKDFAPSKLLSYAASLPPGYPEPPDTLAGDRAGNKVRSDNGGLEDVAMEDEVGDADGAGDGMAGRDTDNVGDVPGDKGVTPNNETQFSRCEGCLQSGFN